MFKNVGLRTKLAMLAIAQLVLMSAVLLFLYYRDAKHHIVQQSVEKARSVVLTAEATREEIGKSWESGIHNAEQLRAWADAGDTGKILAAVPVVTAMRAARSKAQEAGYEFRTPKFQPRNPKNEPDPFESRVLKILEEKGLAEYHEVDPATNTVRYFRPVKLTAECLLCHGDPSTSQAVWGNEKGLDPTGAKMEGWKVGEIHGAFEVVQSLKDADNAIAASMWEGVGVVAGLAAILAGLATYFSSRTVNHDVVNPIKQSTAQLTEAAAQINDAASQVASSSQQLAEGASEQASSLEETSSALEEMAAMTRNNADSATQANDLANKVRQAAEESDSTMRRLNETVDSMAKSSNEVSKIIKVIEEIAFQTNLLALNAAVEAARAGEHGKGFAVVAEEVRNLAQRSATAARDSTELISNSVERTREGSTIAASAVKAMQGIASDVVQVAELVGQITRASREQSQGVEQINSATSQLDHITQQNAAGAEESASAAEELSAQSETMRSLVMDLARSVGVKVAEGTGSVASSAPKHFTKPSKAAKKSAVPSSNPSADKSKSKPLTKAAMQAALPELSEF